MSIYDRARDALKKATPGPWDYDGTCVHDGENDLLEDVGAPLFATKPNLELAALAPEAAAAVVRAADLADSLEARAEGDEYSPAEQSAYRVAALELRAALEGAEE